MPSRSLAFSSMGRGAAALGIDKEEAQRRLEKVRGRRDERSLAEKHCQVGKATHFCVLILRLPPQQSWPAGGPGRGESWTSKPHHTSQPEPRLAQNTIPASPRPALPLLTPPPRSSRWPASCRRARAGGCTSRRSATSRKGSTTRASPTSSPTSSRRPIRRRPLRPWRSSLTRPDAALAFSRSGAPPSTSLRVSTLNTSTTSH